MIDNVDSFTYNLVQALLELGARVTVRRNHAITAQQATDLAPSHLVISPGPGRPEHAGNALQVLSALMDRVPILGVCLGHQCIAQLLGAEITHARQLRHGKASPVHTDEQGLFQGLPSPLTAGRYHSLAIDEATLPDCLTVTARTEDGEVMAIRHRDLPVQGVQFHPESVLTPDGPALLANFLALEAP
ncbi:MAG: aminodeoxychorismate/anthranilate synthase component II [Myxococcales bacterium]|nr:aminodeoxychorismate/anthranilate synthase component II [Myxococcales bacterium]